MRRPYDCRMSGIPERLLERLDELALVLAERGDALALIALGSVGRDVDRLDDHSDLDFFVITEGAAKQRYLEQIDWLEAVSPVGYSFVNTADGRKVLFSDGLYAEYAIFTVDELGEASFPPGRLVWSRADAPAGLDCVGSRPDPTPYDSPEFQVNEALTNIYVGLHRDARGERLAGSRLIQTHAVDRLLTLLDLTGRRCPTEAGRVRCRARGRGPVLTGGAAAGRDGAGLRAQSRGGSRDSRVARVERRGESCPRRRDSRARVGAAFARRVRRLTSLSCSGDGHPDRG